MYAELASMRASSCFGIVNLWQGQIPKQLLCLCSNNQLKFKVLSYVYINYKYGTSESLLFDIHIENGNI